MADQDDLTLEQMLAGLLVGVPKNILAQHIRDITNTFWKNITDIGGGPLVASDITNDSGITGVTVKDALNTLIAGEILKYFANGAAIDTIGLSVTEAGGVVSFNLDDGSGGNVDIQLSGVIRTYVKGSVVLLLGTDEDPKENWIYLEVSIP